MAIVTINPFTNSQIASYEEHTSEELQIILSNADVIFKKWRTTTFKERVLLMHNAAEILLKNRNKYANTISLEMGKPINEAIAEVEKCAWVCNFYADNAEQFLATETIETDAQSSKIKYQPLGAILAVMPWNYPFWQVFRFAAPSLMAGNVGLLKHAGNVLGSAKHIEDIFIEAGFPKGVFQNLFVGHDAVKDILENKFVKAVSLTGSEKAGASVAAIAGKNIKKSLLELGGSNAFIVLSDADIKQAVSVGVKARMQNAGQSCIAAKRFILMDDIAEKFITAFTDEVNKLISGDPLETTTQMGPLARVDLAEQIEKQVNDSIAKGAKLIAGGKRKNAFYSPTVLINVTPGMPAFDEELFGPVAAITIVKTEEEALAHANNSEFGLGATVFTNSKQKADYFIDNIEDGAVFINALVKSDPRLPFGGTKKSGYGRELGKYGILEFVNIKTVYIDKGLK
ncbi:MAG: NAD-dependent succinate-semialdehyde dehydrogenase [Bacteroidetes bacterium]|nr:NAD-dependent succinate-semialdehyde dehydrogenase [Bacteroidota bacterium]MBP7399622.1 NAD-dependent succinate-semialdehyde dehydrogenase [Chitinophagales bacterium]MBK7108223.1 NAD-dependent succinate-semialdehyde dehydrogenase [Bacteroidota bacterium]MBK8486352.1 NAD-dependent succinate-semialdehyde dehydrogenase [Bacteroidota bacterium]MBP8754064.1 NAD-dependent succinate-semialdehyde dehydrogenase [Chitinophagales bacterium]